MRRGTNREMAGGILAWRTIGGKRMKWAVDQVKLSEIMASRGERPSILLGAEASRRSGQGRQWKDIKDR